MAALEVSLAAVACRRSTIGGDVERLESAGSRYGAARPGGEATRGAVVSHARVFLLRIGRGEKTEEPGRGTSPAPAIPARAMMSQAAERRSGRQGLSKDARGRYSRFEFLIALPQRKKVMKRSRGDLETVVADAGGPRVRIRLPPAASQF